MVAVTSFSFSRNHNTPGPVGTPAQEDHAMSTPQQTAQATPGTQHTGPA